MAQDPATQLKEKYKDRQLCLLVGNQMSKVVDSPLCDTRLSANSTFKIALALMGFQAEIIKDPEASFKWDGKVYSIKSWNKDHDALSWMKDSVVWVSQKLTPLLGMEKTKDFLQKFAYGNQDMSGGLTEAWLSSTLKISPVEQWEFLDKLKNRKLPVSRRARELTLDILPKERAGDFILRAKTGSGFSSAEGRVGWYVGYFQVLNEMEVFVAAFKEFPQTNSAYGGPELKEGIVQYFKQRSEMH